MSLVQRIPRFRAAEAALPALAEREAWPRERIEAHQLEALTGLWERAATAPHWRDLIGAGAVPRRFESLDQLAELPILPKQTVRRHPAAFLTTPQESGSWHRTGGASGSPTAIWWPRAAYRQVLRTKYAAQRSWGVGLFDRTAFFLRPAWREGKPVARWREGLRLEAECRLRNRRWWWLDRFGPREAASMLARMESFDPVMIYGYSRSVALLAGEAERTGRRFPSLRVVVLTSEPAGGGLVAAVERGFGAPVALEYGVTECALIAHQSPNGGLRVREDLAVVETLPRDDGRWDVVLTVLCNPGFPLLRYALDDVVDAPLQRPPVGLATIGGVRRRDDDFLVDAAERLIDPIAIKDAFEAESAVRWFRVRQELDGRVEARVELFPRSSPDLGRMRSRLVRLLEGRAVEIVIAGSVQSPNGTRGVITSELAPRPAWEGNGPPES